MSMQAGEIGKLWRIPTDFSLTGAQQITVVVARGRYRNVLTAAPAGDNPKDLIHTTTDLSFQVGGFWKYQVVVLTADNKKLVSEIATVTIGKRL